jgi:hypothetical protein
MLKVRSPGRGRAGGGEFVADKNNILSGLDNFFLHSDQA